MSQAVSKRPRGRKSTFNDKDAEEIASRLAKGEPLAAICRDEWLPGLRTVYDWMEAHPDFAALIARARDIGFDVIAADCLTIADAPNATTNANGEVEVRDPARDRLRVDTRLKLLAKWDPKRYGDRMAVTGADGGALQIEDKRILSVDDMSPEERWQLRELLDARLAADAEDVTPES